MMGIKKFLNIVAESCGVDLSSKDESKKKKLKCLLKKLEGKKEEILKNLKDKNIENKNKKDKELELRTIKVLIVKGEKALEKRKKESNG